MARREIGIVKLRDVIDWESFRPLLEKLCGYAGRDWSKGGAPPFDPVFLFKVLVLQKYHGLSDEATEVQISDRLSFLNFLGLELGSRQLFEHFSRMLDSQGFIAREGSIVDASFTEVPRQRNSRKENDQIKAGGRPVEFDQNPARGRQKDTQARWTKKSNPSYYGYKNHTKVDLKSKLIVQSTTTAASVHDSQAFKELEDGQDRVVLADSAYHSKDHQEHLGQLQVKDCLMEKGTRQTPLTPAQEKRNHTISRMRVRVEHVYGSLKQMQADTCRTIGLKRACQHNLLANLTCNMDRYALLAA